MDLNVLIARGYTIFGIPNNLAAIGTVKAAVQAYLYPIIMASSKSLRILFDTEPKTLSGINGSARPIDMIATQDGGNINLPGFYLGNVDFATLPINDH